VFDADAAAHALGFFPTILRLNGGQFEGRPFQLLGFQDFIIGSLMGWRRRDSGKRRFRTAYVEIGKGNGKSPLAGGLGLYGLTSDDEARAEVYAAATKREQALILFRDAVAMVDQSPDLKARIVKTPARSDTCWNLAFPKNGSFFRVIASEDKQSGPRPHFFLIDELHEHPNATVVSMAAAGQKWRRSPLTFEITNSGFDRTTICYQHHEYSVGILQGSREDDEWFAYVCALDEDEDPLDPAVLDDRVDLGIVDARGRPLTAPRVWLKANPGLGSIITEDYLLTQVRQAQGMPAEASRVRRLNFCQWVGAENPWIDPDLWQQTEKDFDALDALRACDEVVGGLDLSGTRDLSALALTGLVPDIVGLSGQRVVARVEQWTPADTIVERSRADLVRYDVWAEQGHLHAVPGKALDYAWIAARMVELQAQLPQFKRVACDPYRLHYLEVELDAIGAEFELVKHPQGYYKAAAKTDDEGRELPTLWMPRSIELLGAAVVGGTIDVEKNPLLTHNSASAVLEADPKNNKIFTKRKSRGRIDGLVALAESVGLLLLDKQPVEDLDDFINSPVIA